MKGTVNTAIEIGESCERSACPEIADSILAGFSASHGLSKEAAEKYGVDLPLEPGEVITEDPVIQEIRDDLAAKAKESNQK